MTGLATTWILAPPAPPPEMSSKLGSIFPIGASILFILFSPVVTSKVVGAVEGWLAKDAQSYGVTSETTVPPHQSTKAILDYVEYTADAVQVVPATYLPVVGALFAVASNELGLAAIVILVVLVVVAFGLDAWVLSSPPQDYISRKFHGYSVINLIAILCNVIGIVTIIAFG